MNGVMAESPELMVDSSFSPVPQRTSSTESNFRELDDAFLQKQARIWLGEVLQIRFDEQMNISELLADGKLLFEVSEVLSRMLPMLSVDETLLKVYEWKPLASNKSTRRYMPYYNVDSFLRMCKNLGMDGIDLFTPSDVVERKNTRKVCMCLRSLSKKAKLRELNVPDFDSVTCTVVMPTDMVECIRKSLEMSQSSSSLSVEQDAEKVSRIRYWRRMSDTASAVSNSCPDNGDEAESSFVVADTNGSSDYDVAESLEILDSPVVADFDSALEINVKDVKHEDDDQCEYLSPCKVESVGSPCSQYYSDEDLCMPSSNCLGSRISGKGPKVNSDTDSDFRIADVSHVPIDWEDFHEDVGNYKDVNADDDEVDSVSRVKKNGDTVCSHEFYPSENNKSNEHLKTSNNPSTDDCENSSELGELHSKCKTDFLHAGDDQRLRHEDNPLDNIGAKHIPFVVEVNPNPSTCGNTNKELSSELLIEISHVSKPTQLPDFSYNVEKNVSENGNVSSEDGEGQLRFEQEESPCSIDYDVQNHNCSSLLVANSNSHDDPCAFERFVAQIGESTPLLLDVDTIIRADDHCSQINNDREEAFSNIMIVPHHTEQNFDNGYIDCNAGSLLDMPCTDINSSPFMVMSMNSTKYSMDCNIAEDGSEGHDNLIESVDDKLINKDDLLFVNSFITALGEPQLNFEPQSLTSVEDTGHANHRCLQEVEKGESEVVKQEGTGKELQSYKPLRKLLKSVVKGTAVLGVAVFLLHLRKNRRENRSEAKKQATHIVKQGLHKPKQMGQKVGSTSSVYPAEKLRLGI
ncbi:uncharacterized protein LOC130828306 isoform X2 [Amaranthus tricolor]|uniref:uncharacterized protein LOC130828306 isoform X2 n=1 Tax=Amaranthus tricolor TaxID=29722 RepID=UPI00258738F3|nr:uncharacterized protein LOC130828306 isoform X2 [Amaranthus tricolor]